MPNQYFGCRTFNDHEQQERLPKNAYKKLKNTIKTGAPLDNSITDHVASAMKSWAIEQGATHYAHWFQPLTGLTAEKHDSFFSFSKGDPIMEFSDKQLIQGEPDASSFPSGGIRQTFEARGYTAWDPTSPAFILEAGLGFTLFIPTVFCSYLGDALDMKTPLMKSQACLATSAKKLLKLMGREVDNVFPTTGLEQEYFLIDDEFYNQRPDLIASGRTLFGNSPLKGQELDDHYFGSIPQRVLRFMQDSERALYELGVPVKTRHNEVAPNQFELASIFEPTNLAVDHNLLVMIIMKEIAHKHKFRMITHEKPFKGVNGCGKHSNWSLCDSEGHNLLDPGDTPHKNLEFITFLAAVVRAIDLWPALFRISIATASNDHRLGAHEAPPAILSVFLGDQLTQVIQNLISDDSDENFPAKKPIELGVSTLPPLPRDNSDRNRTCPFAFTGNKFEFRSLGANQNASAPNYILNTVVAESIDYISDLLTDSLTNSDITVSKALESILKDIFKKHQRVIYNGDGYSDDWTKEAAKRGLPNYKTLVDAVEHYDSPEAIRLFDKYKIMNNREVVARKNVRLEKYITEIMIETRSMLEIANTIILPAALKQQESLANSIKAVKIIFQSGYAMNSTKNQESRLSELSSLIESLLASVNELAKCNPHQQGDDHLAQARYTKDDIIPKMNGLRDIVDVMELIIDDSLWPMPKYREILSII
ncbi:MAG: glutamine synthetase III [SAR324 cluster bacterium]|nr:glutamine synthetase III [SAR324 cluster bacterium]